MLGNVQKGPERIKLQKRVFCRCTQALPSIACSFCSLCQALIIASKNKKHLSSPSR